MKTGIIAPINNLDLAEGRPFHLCLSHLCSDPTYREFYRREAERGSFITLDNSAHEQGHGEDIRRLVGQAEEIGAREVVLPDELFSYEGTIRRTRQSLERLSPTHLRLMVVPQGHISDERSYWRCWDDLISLYREFSHVFLGGLTIGLSKDYEVLPGGMPKIALSSLVRIFSSDLSNRNVRIHLLGWGRDLTALEEISRMSQKSLIVRDEMIRSTDSAKPIMFAVAGVDLSEGIEHAKYPGRAANFFDLSLTAEQRALAIRNIQTFDRLASGEVIDVPVR